MAVRLFLIRHGKPTLSYNQFRGRWIASGKINQLLDAYDLAGLDPEWNRKHLKQGLDYPAISSDLPRALDTAVLYTGRPAAEIETNPIFREIPLGRFRFSWWRLPSWSLLALVRLGWLTGLLPCEESRRASLARVRAAADLLEEQVLRTGNLALYSHGFFLWLLMRELRRRGWQGTKKGRFQYLECALFKKPEPGS